MSLKHLVSLAISTVFLCAYSYASGKVNNASKTTDQVLVITDIHFNPYTSCGESVTPQSQQCLSDLINESNPSHWKLPSAPLNAYAQDSNNTFLIQGLQGLSEIVKKKHIQQVFITGDLLSHNFPADFARYLPAGTQAQLTNLTLNSLTYVIYNVAKATNNAKIFYVLGNNDTDTFDYIYPTESFMQRIGAQIAPYMADPQSFAATFGQGGYFSMNLNQRVIVIGLNFNLLTEENAFSESTVARAKQQLVWLNQQLASAKSAHKRVIILQHEPFGVNTYNAANGATPKSLQYMVLKPNLQQQYLASYTAYNQIINNYYYGHYHMDSVQVAANLFAFSTLGFNVDFGNNPGFKIIKLNQLGQLQDYTTYSSNFTTNSLKWQELYSLNSTYAITPENYISFFSHFPAQESSPSASAYINYYNGASHIKSLPQPINLPGNWRYYYCSLANMESMTYQLCLTAN